MAASAPCPKCNEAIHLEDADELGRVQCLACGEQVSIDTLSSEPAPSGAADEPDEYALQTPNVSYGSDDETGGYSLEEMRAQREQARKLKKAKQEAGTGKKKSKKSSARKDTDDPFQNPAVLGGIAVAAVLVLGVGGWWLFSGKKPAANANAVANVPGGDAQPPAQNGVPAAAANKSSLLDTPSAPVIIDKPVAGIAAAAVEAPKPLWHAIPPFDEAASLKRADVERNSARTTKVAESASQTEIASKPAWTAEPDPLPADLKYTIAKDLRFELKGPGEHAGVSPKENDDDQFPNMYLFGVNLPPVLADQQGPYIIVPPVWEQSPYGRALKPSRNKLKQPNGTYITVEKPQKPIPVVDLRNGESAGEFDWRIPFFRNPALGPDGKYLVGPYNNPVTADRNEKPSEEELEKRRSLYVWERDSKKPPRKLEMPGLVACMRFSSPTTIAILVEQPKRQLQIWDVSTAKQVGKIDLPTGPATPSKDVFPYMYTDTDRTDLLTNFPRAMEMLAISPGGRYAAVAGMDGVSLVSFADEKILGTVEIKNPAPVYEDYLGMAFLPDGDELAVALRTPDGKTRYLACRVADGTIRRQAVIGGQARGPLWVNPDRQSFILASFPGGTLWTHPKPPEPLLYDLDKSHAERFMFRWTTPEHMAPVVLRMPDEGPVLVIQEPGYKHLPDITVPTVLTVARDLYVADINKKIAINEHGLPKRPAPALADRSAVQPADAQPPAQWVAMEPVLPPRPFGATTMGRVPFPLTWSNEQALSLTAERRSTEGFRSTYYMELDGRLSHLGAPGREQTLPIFPWAVAPENVGWSFIRDGGVPVALQADGKRLAIADPDQTGHITVMGVGADDKTSVTFPVYQSEPQAVVWTAFDSANRVLIIAGGELSGWEVDEKGPRCVFALRGDYMSPAVLSGDRSKLAVSLAASVDLIDLATRKVLNRCNIGGKNLVIDASFSPTGKHLAVLLANVSSQLSGRLRQGELPHGQTKGHLAIWDLSTGKSEITDAGFYEMGLVTWLTPEHVAVVAPTTSIVDLKVNRICLTCSGVTGNDRPRSGYPLNVSPDGRIWIPQPESEAVPDAFTHSWQVSMFSRPLSDELKPYFAADRQLFDLLSTPIQIKIDLGDTALGTTHGQSIAASLQKHGCKIGPGGLTLDATASVAGTGEYISFAKATVEVPTVLVKLELKSPQGQPIWQSGWAGRFPGERSRYVTKPDYETRVRNGGATFYDFKGRDPTKAMVEEIMQTMKPIEVSSNFPVLKFFGDGRFVDVQKTIKWEAPPAKN